MSNREYADLILLGLFFIYILLLKSARTELKNIFKIFITLLREPAFKLILYYQTFCFCVLYAVIQNCKLSLWTIKDYLLVVLFAVIPTIAKIKNLESTITIKKEIFNSFTITGIVMFLTDQYNFSIVSELILNLSLITLTVFQVALHHQEKNNFSIFLNISLSMLGLVIIVHSLIGLVADLNKGNNILILIEYLSEFIFWLLNIPLLFAWLYIGQFDIMENFLSYKKTSLSILKNFSKLLLKKHRFRNLKFDLSIINNIQLGGLGKRCYLITISNNYQERDISNILLLFSVSNAPNCLYRQNHVDKVLPFTVRIIDEDSRQTIKTWFIPHIKNEFKDMFSG